MHVVAVCAWRLCACEDSQPEDVAASSLAHRLHMRCQLTRVFTCHISEGLTKFSGWVALGYCSTNTPHTWKPDESLILRSVQLAVPALGPWVIPLTRGS